MNNETNSVIYTVDKWVEAFNNKDTDALFALYDPESVYSNPEAPLMMGVEQVRPWYEEALPEMIGTLKYKKESIFQEEKMAVVVIKFYIEPFEINENEEPFKGRAVLVFRKSKDGKWLLLVDMDHTAPDIFAKDFD